MTEEQEIKNAKEVLVKICDHKLFTSSPTHTRLLNYLVEKAFANEELNEVIIGSDLFGIDYSKETTNGTVRSYMYRLRKKLEEFYNDDKHKDLILFKIEKGQYNIRFEAQSNKKAQSTNNKLIAILSSKAIKISLIIAIFIAWFGLYFIFNSLKTDPIWKPYFRKNAQTILVISDQFVVNRTFDNNEECALLMREISSFDDFLKFSKQHPELQLRTNDYTLMTKMAPVATKMLTEWFLQHNSDFSIKLESKITYEDVRDNNIVFIGQFKTMNLSKSLFLKSSKVFATFGDGFRYKHGSEERKYTTKYSTIENVEYALVSVVSVSEGRQIIFFSSNNDIGVMGTLKKFTDKQWLKSFRKQIGNSTQFNALFEVSGIHRNDIGCKMIEIEKLN